MLNAEIALAYEEEGLRYLGGSTNHWGGWCRPLAPIDFEARDWIPHSGWPITRADLDPWYKKAQPIIETGPFKYESADFWGAQFGETMPDVGESEQPGTTQQQQDDRHDVGGHQPEQQHRAADGREQQAIEVPALDVGHQRTGT